MNRLTKNSLLLATAAFAGLTAQAQFFQVGTSDPAVAGNGTAGGAFFGDIGADGARAVGFHSGFNVNPFTLSQVQLSLNSGTGGHTARVRLFSGTSTAPTTFVATLSSGLAVSTTATVYNIGGASTVLAGNSYYWIVVDQDSAGTSLRWNKSNTGNGTTPTSGPRGIVYAGAYSNTADDLSGTSTTGLSETPNFAVYTVELPEPHEYAFIAGLGLCGFAVCRRRFAEMRAVG